MGSAKTALLLTTAYNFEERNMRYVCMKPVIDTRDKKNVIRSRIGIERECKWIYPESDLYEMAREAFREAGGLSFSLRSRLTNCRAWSTTMART